MNRLLKIEFRKMFNAPAFWVLSLLYLVSMAVVFYGLQEYVVNKMKFEGPVDDMLFARLNIYRFPDIWHNLTYVAGFFLIIPGILVIIFTTNEFTYRTIRQHIIDGMSREEWVLSKLMIVALLTFVSTLFLTILGLTLGMVNTPGAGLVDVFEGAQYLTLYFLQMTCYLVFALLLSLMLKRSGLTIGLFLLYIWVVERILAYTLPGNLGDFLPLESADRLLPMPFVKYFQAVMGESEMQAAVGPGEITSSFVWLLLLVTGTYMWVRRSDL